MTPVWGVKAVPRARRWKWAAIGGAAALAVALAAVAWWFARPSYAEGAPIVVADFVNRTGDTDFDATLKQALMIKIAESPFMRVVPQQRVQETLKLMARRPDEAVTPALGLEMCQRIGAGALMTGEISRLGSSYFLTLAAQSCRAGEEIAREDTQVSRKEDVLTALNTELASIRQRLGESLASVQQHNKPLAEATTSSLAALKSLSLGDQRHDAGRDLEAIPFYQRAVELDPQFAMAWARLGTVYSNTGEMEQARRFYNKAFELRDRAGDRERLYITGHYYRINGELAKARQVYELWQQTYPHDFMPAQNLGVVLEELGEREEALKTFREASALEPRNGLARQVIAESLYSLGRYDEARRQLENQMKDLGDTPSARLMLYMLDYITGNRQDMIEQKRRLAGTSMELDREAVDYHIAVFEGRYRDASGMFDDAVARAEAAGRTEMSHGGAAQMILERAAVGFTTDTRARATRLLAMHPDLAPKDQLQLALALAIAGDVQQAKAIATPAWANLRFDPGYQRAVRPAYDALFELKQGQPGRAIELLKAAEPWEGRTDKGARISSEIRGRAYLALRDGKSAEAEFQRRLNEPGLDALDIGRVVDRLQIGRARALAGDKTGARKAYEEFFALWKNADPDIPLLQKAKAEYQALQ